MTTPTTPTPTPITATTISIENGGGFTGCIGSISCDFQMPIRNTGAGCATEVRGTVSFFNAQNQQVGAIFNWTALGVIRPNEQVVVRALGVPTSVRDVMATYRGQPSWTNTRC